MTAANTMMQMSAPAEGSIAGAAVTLLEHLVKVWRAKTARKEMLDRQDAADLGPGGGLQ